MDNPTRSKRTRDAAIQAALDIIARDGPGRLTLDAIARESGISKGGLMHQFPTKDAVLKALLEHHTEYFDAFRRDYLAEHDGLAQPHLAAEIAIFREVLAKRNPAAFAILGAIAQDPSLLHGTLEPSAQQVAAFKAEADDPDLATLRWAAARGLAVTALIGMCPLSDTERSRLFDRLLDDRQWQGCARPGPSGSGDSQK